ncbi:RNA-directed DNA polymerase, eukaryota [Tanacetum coccineum]
MLRRPRYVFFYRYLGVMVGEYSSRIKAWDDVILKLRSRLSKWKVKTLSIGGRLTLLKSVLGASPIYNMSIFKVPTGVLKVMESIRSRFFNGADQSEKKVTWVAWNKVLASKKHGGLGVSSFFALNRALLLKWVWRFVSQDGSLWYKVIRALYGSSVETHSTSLSSNWCSIMREVNKLKGKGFDFWSHCKKRIGNGDDSRFWFDCWIGDVPLRVKFPRLFALDLNKEASVAVKLSAPIDISFRRNARGGIEEHLLADLTSLMDSVTLSNSGDRWVCDLVSDGNFRVKEIRNYIDDLFLPHQAAQTRWIKYIPIKVNIFAWRARQDCLPTRVNLIRRGITIESSLCPVCSVCEEDVCHIFFRCDLAQLVLRRICRWWGLDPHDWSSFQEWQSWILSIQFSSKIWYDEDVHDLRSIETKFPAIVFNDNLTSNETLSCEPTVSSLNNNKIDFRISFDESDDEDYTVFDKNSFSYKIISANDLKTDSKNDNEKVNIPLYPSPEPLVSYIDDLDFFKDFENEFPSIVYNDALTSKSDFSTEPTLCPQHIDEFDLKDETSLLEYDEVEQNVLYFTDLFPFNIIYPDDLKSDKDNDNNEIDMIQSSRGNENTQGSNKLLENLYVPFGIPFDPKRYYKDGDCTRMLQRPNMALLPRDQRHQYLRFEGLQYTKGDIADFETMLAKIYRREVHRVQVFDFRGLPDLMTEGLSSRMLMDRDAQWKSVFTSQAWRRLFDIRGSLVHELILEFFSTFGYGEAVLDLDTAGALQDPKLRLCHRLITCSIVGRNQAPEKVTVIDLFYLRGMDVGSFVARLAEHFGLLTKERLQGLTVIVRDLPVIDMDELVRLHICVELDDTWAWVAPGPERQPDAATGAPEDALIADEGAPAVPAPV